MKRKEWLTENDPEAMVRYLQEKGQSDRKLRLFMVACCDQIQDYYGSTLADPQSYIRVAEAYADGQTSGEELEKAYSWTGEMSGWDCPLFAISCACHADVAQGLDEILPFVLWPDLGWNEMNWRGPPPQEESSVHGEQKVAIATLLREMFRGPRAPVLRPKPWRTDSVLGIAQTIYQKKQFEDMPVLGDALEDAGCDQEEALSHCREGDHHARGCWLLDLLLDRR